uniref:hypothetical protein n=1 Tax=Shewanella baltica TaxID=62322 RepID=UPI004048E493
MPDKFAPRLREKSNYPMGLLEVDIDPAAERFAILERVNLRLLWQSDIPADNQVKHLIRKDHSLAGVIFIMFDADEQFNARIIDGFKLPLVDSHSVSLGY